MRNEQAVKLSKERRDELIAEIKRYFLHDKDEEIGDLAAGLMLDFILEKIAPEFYNQGVYDAHTYMTDAAEDLLSIQK